MARWIAALAVVLSAVAVAGRVDAAPSRTRSPSQAPAYSPDFPDPFVLRAGGTYWAYSTGSGGRNLQVIQSSDLATWTGLNDPLPTLPSWAASGLTWAPGVLSRGSLYRMYYTVRDAAVGRQCISVATSSTPSGPFVDKSQGPFICQLNPDLGGSIDPNPYVAPDGTAYLLWKSDNNALGHPTQLWAQQLSSDGLSLLGTPVKLLTESPGSWQSPIIEGPTMVASGGRYYLFYGAGDWATANASIGFATCRTPVTPCTNRSVFGPWMATHGSAIGPSGPAVFTTSTGATEIAYHAWTGGPGYPQGKRSMWIDQLTFVNGQPGIG